MKEMGAAMRRARESTGTSRAFLAYAANIHVNTLASYETGHKAPTLPVLVRLADVLHVSLDEYVGRSAQ